MVTLLLIVIALLVIALIAAVSLIYWASKSVMEELRNFWNKF